MGTIDHHVANEQRIRPKQPLQEPHDDGRFAVAAGPSGVARAASGVTDPVLHAGREAAAFSKSLR